MARLSDAALLWYESTLGRLSPDGTGISKEMFKVAFMERYVTDEVSTHARKDLDALQQNDMHILAFNEKFTVAVDMLKLAPGDEGITGSTATGKYILALNPTLRDRLGLMCPNMHITPIAELMRHAAAAQKALDVKAGFDGGASSRKAAKLTTSLSPPAPVTVNALADFSDDDGEYDVDQAAGQARKRKRSRKSTCSCSCTACS